jgi:hypothetical protein
MEAKSINKYNNGDKHSLKGTWQRGGFCGVLAEIGTP